MRTMVTATERSGGVGAPTTRTLRGIHVRPVTADGWARLRNLHEHSLKLVAVPYVTPGGLTAPQRDAMLAASINSARV